MCNFHNLTPILASLLKCTALGARIHKRAGSHRAGEVPAKPRKSISREEGVRDASAATEKTVITCEFLFEDVIFRSFGSREAGESFCDR
ncbi:hypothetical protein Y032_0044g1041 [Ancylostoma ceylanicum]|uniref:Uncharacterized protein n=1 Tax=Ancylostoma ceylanicum TaxID=53326 RepID=A0A016UE63_9BILA|nr:hypothetical protein Y032_0044g1041 [Ancylostoma ceylanicum]